MKFHYLGNPVCKMVKKIINFKLNSDHGSQILKKRQKDEEYPIGSKKTSSNPIINFDDLKKMKWSSSVIGDITSGKLLNQRL